MSSPLRLRSAHDFRCELRHSKSGRKSNAFTHHTVIGIRYLCLLSCPQLFRYIAHSLGTSIRNACASNRRILHSFWDVWYNIIVIKMLRNRHALTYRYTLTHSISLALIINGNNKNTNTASIYAEPEYHQTIDLVKVRLVFPFH